MNPIEDERLSPTFKASSATRNKVTYKTPNAVPMDQIVIINNHEYVEKLHPPQYKVRTMERRTEDIKRSQNRLKPENSKSEEKFKRDYINIDDSKLKTRE